MTLLASSACTVSVIRPRFGKPDETPADDRRLVAALLAGDERAFRELVDLYHAALVRTARGYVRDLAVAEEVAQETWLAVLTGLERFEGRSSLKTWIFRILTNRALTRATRERRSTPFSAIPSDGTAVDPDRFTAGAWSEPPQPWSDMPSELLLAAETRERLLEAIDSLPDAQRLVITLRDIEGFDAAETCDLLQISDGNQRVLLHRARSRVRELLEPYLQEVSV